MIPDLEKLVHLQRTVDSLTKVETELVAIPRRKAELEAQLQSDRGRVDGAREALATSQKAQRQLEAAVQDLKAKASKYKGQLMEVKTNKEYTAMLHEIETVEREIRSTDDRILEEMEKTESLQAEIQREEAVFVATEQDFRAEVKQLEERAAVLRGEAETLGSERETVAATLPQEVIERFQRVARLRGGGVAEARDATCQACNVKLRLQMYVDIKRNDTLIQCPNCSRILYYEAPPATVDPAP